MRKGKHATRAIKKNEANTPVKKSIRVRKQNAANISYKEQLGN